MSNRGKQYDAARPARKSANRPTYTSRDEQQNGCLEIWHSAINLKAWRHQTAAERPPISNPTQNQEALLNNSLERWVAETSGFELQCFRLIGLVARGVILEFRPSKLFARQITFRGIGICLPHLCGIRLCPQPRPLRPVKIGVGIGRE